MKRFLIGLVTGALLMHLFLQYGGQWFVRVGHWFGSAAAGYRGDSHQQRAREVLR